MKRLWIGIGLLVVILIAAILVPEILEHNHTPIIRDLERASQLAMEENWDSAQDFSRRAEKKWKKIRPVTASFTDHEPMDEIDALFAQLKVYAEAQDMVAYSSTCAYLSSQLGVLGDYHNFTLWNLF